MRASFALSSLSALVAAGALVSACSSSVESDNASGATSGTSSGSSSTAGVGGGETTTSASSSTAAGTGGSAEIPSPAPHPGMPQIPNLGGVVLHDPVIVTVTFPSDDLEADVQKFDDEIGSLKWWA